jgi:hypothetical protein
MVPAASVVQVDCLYHMLVTNNMVRGLFTGANCGNLRHGVERPPSVGRTARKDCRRETRDRNLAWARQTGEDTGLVQIRYTPAE